MDKSLLIQQQIRGNNQDLEGAYLSLKAWEKEMKRKDAQLRQYNQCPNQDKACAEADGKEETTNVAEIKELCNLESTANEFKIKGNLHVKKNEWQKAIKCYTEAINIHTDATFYANRALCHLKLDNLHSTEDDCTAAIQLNKNYVKAYHRRALARIKLKKYYEAKKDIHKILELEPSNKEGKSLLQHVNQILENIQQGVIITEVPNDYNLPNTDEDKTDTKIIKKKSECSTNNEKITEKATKTKNEHIAEKQTKSNRHNNLPSWIPDLENNYEIINPINKPPHQRYNKPMKKISVTEVNFGSSVLSKSTKQLEIESKKQSSKCLLDSEIQIQKTKEFKNNQILIEVISEEVNKDLEIPRIPKTAVQFLSDWNGTNSLIFRYNYLKQLNPDNFSSLFKDFLEFDVLREILDVLNKQFMKRNEPVYKYLENLSNVKRFGALILFMNSDDKKVVEQLLEYAESTEQKSIDDISRLRIKYEIHNKY